MTAHFRALFCAAALFAATPHANAQPDLQRELAELKTGQKAMQRDIEEIKQLLLKAAPRPAGAVAPSLPPSMATGGVLVKGDPNAPITIVEYTDLQCPFCGRYTRSTFSQIDNEYIKTGKVRYVIKDFPLESIHGNALRAAEATHCAADQHRAWQMHDHLIANQQKLGQDDLSGYAGTLGLDVEKFKACLDSGRYTAEIRKEMAAGQSLGVNGTPTFFLGDSGATPDQMKPRRMLAGALEFAAFKSLIDELATKQGKTD